jgi:mycothiol S-conjugate amidase
MPDSPANADPRSFAMAPLEEAAGRLVAVIRRTRPQIVITYPREQTVYPHPDHLRVNEISEVAFDAAGDPDSFPDAGPPWQPLRLYYVRWSVKRIRAMHEKFVELGLESHFNNERLARLLEAEANALEGTKNDRPHIVVDIRDYNLVMREALRAHASQVDPNSSDWFGLPAEVADEVYPFDEYELARDLTAVNPSSDDLFAGLDTVKAI